MAPKILRASPKPGNKKARATGKPKGSSPSMVLGSASKAGMQSKQGRNFLLPKTKRKTKDPTQFERGIPKGKKEMELYKFMEKIGKKMGPQKIKMTPEMKNKFRLLISAAARADNIKRVMEKGPRKFPNPRQESTRFMEKGPRKFPNPRQESTRMDKGPRKMNPLKRKK
jgi:hypothetical protein